MEPFKTHRGLIATLDRANIDTDAIIPKQFLKSIRRTGFGPYLFFDWRYDTQGRSDPAFALNQPRFKGASILVTRHNFGCGSSREHAVWAILQDGYKVVVAPSKEEGNSRIAAFADIFRNNAAKCGLLTIELTEPEVQTIFEGVDRHPRLEGTANLENQKFVLHADHDVSFHFGIDPTVKKQLQLGLDEITQTLEYEAEIKAFECSHPTQLASAVTPNGAKT